MTAPLAFEIPGLLLTTPNRREHHYARARRVKHERDHVARGYLVASRRAPLPPAPWVVTVTRVAPRDLDAHDNLPMACKGAFDELALQLGLPNDRDPRATFRAAQCRGTRVLRVAVRVEIASAP